jgi:hypothetical protein
MNLNELFFFKTIPCNKKKDHDYDNCYNHHYFRKHSSIHDSRRPQIGFTIMNRIDYYQENEIISKTSLHIYLNEMGFENDELNKQIFQICPCKNQMEYRYHILNYKAASCFFEKASLKCPYGKLCPDLHGSEDQVGMLEILMFKQLYTNMLDDKMTKNEFKEFYNRIYSSYNNYINFKKHMIDYTASTMNLYASQQSTMTNTHLIKQITNPDNLISPIKSSSQLDSSAIVNNFDQSMIMHSKLQEEMKRNNVEDALLTINFKQHVYNELNNIPTLARNELYTKVINCEDCIVYLSIAQPKREELNKLLIALLNCHNGIIIYGCDINTEKLTGFKMARQQRDKFRQVFNTEYMNYLMEYHGNIKYKFYDLEGDLCILVIKVKKVKDNKTILDNWNKPYIIREKFLEEFANNKNFNKLRMLDIKQLDMKQYIEFTKQRIEDYYKKKLKKF